MEPRNRNTWVIVIIAIVVACLCLAAVAVALASLFIIRGSDVSGPIGLNEMSEERTLNVEPGGMLRVDNFAGSVTVIAGAENQVRMVATRRGRSADLDRIEIDVAQTGDELTVRTRRPAGLANASVELRFEVPGSLRLELLTGAGNVVVEGAAAGVMAGTGSGSISARGLAGGVELQTGSGNVDVQDVSGRLVLDSGSGSLTLQGVFGEVDASTSSGGITMSGSEGTARLDTGSGSVEYEGVPVGECRFETGSGSVVLRLPADLDATVDLRTNSGSVSVQFPVDGEVTQRRVVGIIGSGSEADITAHTGSGSVQVFEE